MYGDIAQLIERSIRIAEVEGLNPSISTRNYYIMNAKQHDNWGVYYDATRDGAHFRLLDQAIECRMGDSYAALDVGAGALRNTRYLRAHSFQVDALDSSPLLIDEVALLNDSLVHAYNQAYDEYTYPVDHYGIIVASSALTFNPPETFWRVIESLKASMAPGGVLCANFSGKRDEWANDPSKSFVAIDEIRAEFGEMKIILCDEWERDTAMAVGGTKHSHIIELIVQKPL